MSINAIEPGMENWVSKEIEAFFDELTGERLPAESVRAAKIEEIEFLRTFPVYEKVPEAQTRGKESVSARWILTTQGDSNRPEIRARWVGREFKWKPPALENSLRLRPRWRP